VIALLQSPEPLSVAASATANPITRVLVVFESESTLPAANEIARGLYRQLNSAASTEIEFYSEFLDMYRFPGPEIRRAVADSLTLKYGGVALDVVIVIGPSILDFILEYRDAIVPAVPMIVGAIGAQSAASLALPAGIGGIVTEFDVRGTVDLARRLQPDARRIVVMTGSAEFDRDWRATAQEQLGDEYHGLAVDYLSGLSLEGFVDAARSLTRDSILVILTIFGDAEGRRPVPRDAAARIATAAGAPSYGVYSTFVGGGIVGGLINTFESIGTALAIQAEQIASGSDVDAELVALPGRPVIDWRQLKRWGLDAARLPEDTDLRFYDPTVWEQYRLQILAALAVILLQAGTIVALIFQNRRRRELSQELALGRLELAHLSRSSQLGELSGAFAHELNQPLTSILANAEAGARLLRKKQPDLKEIEEIFKDIIADDQRAAAVTGQLRQLMLKGETNFEQIDLNDVVASTIALVKSELVARQVRVDFRPDGASMPVRGNATQLKQIVLNLILNATDALAELPSHNRRIEVEVGEVENGMRVLSVSDRGPGLSPEMKEKVFEPFVSTKANGLGLGLAICRTIAEAHGGTLRFDETMGRGARAILTLPSDKR